MPAVLRGSIVTLLLMFGFVAATPPSAQTTTVPPTSVAVTVTTEQSPRTQSAGDTESSRTVNRIVLALLAMAALLLVLLVWLWRTTKPTASHLDGLDAMGSRRWRNSTPEGRAVILAPVHERRGEIRDEDLIATTDSEPAPEPAEETTAAAPATEKEADERPADEDPEHEDPGHEDPETITEPSAAESGEAKEVETQEPSTPLM